MVEYEQHKKFSKVYSGVFMRLKKFFAKTDGTLINFLLLCFMPLILFIVVFYLKDEFSKFMSIASYLTWHNLFEFASVLVSVSVFFVAYYSYEQTHNFKSMYLGSVFLTVALIDAFHTLSFKGMPAFFIENSTANRATTLWIISRLTASVGFIFAGYVPRIQKLYKVDRRVFLIIPIIFSFSTLVIVTNFPDFLPLMYDEVTGLTDTKKNLELVIIFLFFINVIRYIYRYQKSRESLELISAFSMVLSIFSEMAFMQYFSVYDIYNYLGHIYKFISFFLIFRVIFSRNIKKPYIELYEAKQEIKKYADNLDKTVYERTEELRKLNNQLMDELRYARDIQNAMFPIKLPEDKYVTLDAKYFAADLVSGDFYDVFRCNKDNIALIIGDVSGHGVPAAMLTVFVNQTVRTLKDTEAGIMKPSTVLQNLYNSFNKTNFQEDVYIVMLCAIYNLRKRELTYSSAGLNVEPLIITQSGDVKEIKIKGFPICKLVEYYDGNYEDKTVILNPHEKVLFYTDGIIEARSTDGFFFGKERFKDLLRSNSTKSCKELSNLISNSLFEFTHGYALNDDATYIIMEVKE